MMLIQLVKKRLMKIRQFQAIHNKEVNNKAIKAEAIELRKGVLLAVVQELDLKLVKEEQGQEEYQNQVLCLHMIH